MVCGGLPASLWFHCLSSQILVVILVVCGDFGGLWWFAVVCLLVMYRNGCWPTVNCPNFGRSGHSKSSCANSVVCSSPIYLW